MKVITQLVQHFWQRGALTAEDAAYLVRSGFVRAADLAGFKFPSDDEPAALETTIRSPTPVRLRSLEAVQETLVRRGKRSRKKGTAKTAILQPQELCNRVKLEFDRRADDLQNLVLSCPKPLPTSWEEAASQLRRMSPEKCRSAFASRLRQATGGMPGLWNAVDLEPFHHLLSEEEFRGRAARAYSALLVARDAASLGGYGWILKYDEIQALANLRCIHERLLESLCQLYRADRPSLTRRLARGSTPVATWALILLHNANRAASGSPNRFEFGPVAPPEEMVWKQAWTAALEMDRVHVPQLVLDYYGRSAEESPGRGNGGQSVLSEGLALAPAWRLRLNGNAALSDRKLSPQAR